MHLHHNLLPYLMPLSRYGRAQTSESEATDEEGGVQLSWKSLVWVSCMRPTERKLTETAFKLRLSSRTLSHHQCRAGLQTVELKSLFVFTKHRSRMASPGRSSVPAPSSGSAGFSIASPGHSASEKQISKHSSSGVPGPGTYNVTSSERVTTVRHTCRARPQRLLNPAHGTTATWMAA